ncbi:alpha/beta hydrolase [Leptolyngbya sp. FACHB-36]|uniref:alpha/beta hydrolase n=1 Tax=Leptolyngbya sp. FACHB-36 TaxID=2692808 RepID=UPI00168051DA|nr:alpha/beta fold hydrolase [Leptolyngbya sp. FACHB-36]MBD2019844.1 alpha/beta hydrolase [Leptolyngbya sp. FACHB-36]
MLLTTGAIALNAIAWMQAYSMTHFVEAGQRTAKPETLSAIDKLRIVLTGVEIPRPTNHLTPQAIALDHKTAQIAISDSETLEAWYVPRSHSRGIVLMFPPYAGTNDALLASAKLLHDLGFELLLINFRGVGGSSGSTTLGVRKAEDVAVAVAYAKQRWAKQPLILYGASMGATAVMRAIAQQSIKPDAVIVKVRSIVCCTQYAIALRQ